MAGARRGAMSSAASRAAPRCCSTRSRPVTARSISSPTTRRTRAPTSTRSERWSRSSCRPAHRSVVGGSFGLDAGYCLYYPESGRLQFVFVVDFANNVVNTDEHYDGPRRQLGSHRAPAASGLRTKRTTSSAMAASRACCSTTATQDEVNSSCTGHSRLTSTRRSPGYTSRGSVRPGESIEFFVSSTRRTVRHQDLSTGRRSASSWPNS